MNQIWWLACELQLQLWVVIGGTGALITAFHHGNFTCNHHVVIMFEIKHQDIKAQLPDQS